MYRTAIIGLFCCVSLILQTSDLRAFTPSEDWTPLPRHERPEDSSNLALKSSPGILVPCDSLFNPQNHSYLITHGFGGTLPDDRFHILAQLLANQVPNANILILDWSGDAWETDFFGFPAPTKVALKINPVADHFAEQLRSIGLNISRTTLIGESFGNCINARIAQQLGSEGRFLVFNPPSPLGGYPLPDVTSLSQIAWSFHTYSAYDSTELKTDAGFYLECPEELDHHGQHTRGIPWLSEQLQKGNLNWLHFLHQVPSRQDGVFDATADILGNFLPTRHPLKPREYATQNPRPKHRLPSPPNPERTLASAAP